MPIRNFRPTSPGRRNASGFTFEELTKKRPEKSLTVSKNRISGRSHGKISVRRRGVGISACFESLISREISSIFLDE
jgi:large subunit ribosomal protein L2